MEILVEICGVFDIIVVLLVNVWGFGFKKGVFFDLIMIDSLF